jgi:hypothetical protein
MTEQQLTKSFAMNGDSDAPHLQSNARTAGFPPQCDAEHPLESADLIVTSYDERQMRTAGCSNGFDRHLTSNCANSDELRLHLRLAETTNGDLTTGKELHLPSDCTNNNERHLGSASCTMGESHLQSADGTDSRHHLVEEGESVQPGDTLVRAKPFVYAIQSQFRTKICDYCLTL